MSGNRSASVLGPRSSGVLLHVSSIPGSGAIGDLGPQADHWLHWLSEAGCGAWQILPIGPTGHGYSPYQALSSFAGNPLLISPEQLVHDGLLEPEAADRDRTTGGQQVDFEAVASIRRKLLRDAHRSFDEGGGRDLRGAFEEFKHSNSNWLDDYALFSAIKNAQDGAAWNQWPEPLRRRQKDALAQFKAHRSDSVERARFVQFLFDRQWRSLKAKAQELGVRLIGDLPIFVALDSADVWAHQELFQLDRDGKPEVVAGVPPDYFSETGQLWGNPLYHWDRMAANGYRWWIDRASKSLERVDLLRLDHFRGFEAYWEIPAEAPTAQSGRWVEGPGGDFFAALQDAIGVLPLIAEDLGVITPEVERLREHFGLPGMKVLQFAFSGDSSNLYLPHNFGRNCVVYTGTHDNDTSLGWYQGASEGERDHCRRYLAVDGRHIAWDLIRTAWRSVADLSIAPLQDMLELGSDARMNFPGRPEGNWAWRAPRGSLTPGLAARVRELGRLYGRSTR